MYTKSLILLFIPIFFAACGIEKEVYQAKLNELDAAKKKSINLQKKINDKEGEIKEFSSNLSIKKQEIKNLFAKISESDARVEELSKNIEGLSKNKEEAKKEIASLRQQLAGLQSERAQLSSRVDMLQPKLEEIRIAKEQEVAALKEESEGLLRERAHLIRLDEISAEKEKEKTRKIKKLTNLVLAKNSLIEDLSSKISVKDAKLKALSSRKEEAAQKLAALREESEGLLRERAHLVRLDVFSAEKEKEKTRKIKKLTNLVLTKNFLIEDLSSKISVKDAKLKALSSRKEEAVQKLAALRGESEGLLRERSHLIWLDEISMEKEKEKMQEVAKLIGMILAKNFLIEDLSSKILVKEGAVKKLTALREKSKGLLRERVHMVKLDKISAEEEKEKAQEIAKLTDLIISKNFLIEDISAQILVKDATLKKLSASEEEARLKMASLNEKAEGLLRERAHLVKSDEISAEKEEEKEQEIAKLKNLVIAKISLIEDLSTKISAKDAIIKTLSAKEMKALQKDKPIQGLSAKVSAKDVRIEEVSAEKKKKSPIFHSIYKEIVETLEEEIKTGKFKINYAPDKLLIEIGSKILFSSGKADIKESGQEVLKKVGDFLRGLKDKEIRVKGHTDNVPIGPRLKKIFPSNWELSLMRAANVVRFLQQNAGIPPKNISGAGYSMFRPVASNDTPEGREKNRRIEIVLLPLRG